MGLFSRKSSKQLSVNGASDFSKDRNSANSLMSPPPTKVINGQSFSSPSIPDVSLPAPPDPTLDPAAYLRSIYAVRERCSLVYRRAQANQLSHFDVDLSKWRDTVEYVGRIIKVNLHYPFFTSHQIIPLSYKTADGFPLQRDYDHPYTSIPSHGRWQHFEVGGRPRIDQLLSSWPSTIDAQERTRRLIDLFLVSVLLDAGAGTRWSYKSKESGKIYKRSEGLAVASLEMFKSGCFSSADGQPCRVDSEGLRKVNVEVLRRGLQVSEGNPLAGLEGRAGLLERLSGALRNREFFGKDGRPGCMLGTFLPSPTIYLTSYLPTNFALHVQMAQQTTNITQTTSSPTPPPAPPPSP